MNLFCPFSKYLFPFFSAVVFKDAEIPEENLIGELNGGYEIFNRMMVPERLTTAAGSIGVGTAAIEVAASYALKRESFGKKLIEHEGISFKLAESVALLQNASSMVYVASKAADQMEVGKTDLAYVRKLVSIAKLQSTEAMWKIVNDSMQMLGGIGYTTVYPVERLLRILSWLNIQDRSSIKIGMKMKLKAVKRKEGYYSYEFFSI